MLKKIPEDNATGVCVLPNWQTQAWFPKAMKMILQEPVVLNARITLLQPANRPPSASQKAGPHNLPFIRTHLNDKDLSNCEGNHYGLIAR